MNDVKADCDRTRKARPGGANPLRASFLALVLVLLATATPFADYPGDQEIRQTVARISYVFGDVSFSRGDDPDEWQQADLNVPMTLGDRVYTGRDGRLELQITGGNFARVGSNTDLTALNMTEETKQFSVNEGLASFQIRRFDEDEVIEVDTPNAAVTFERTGEYRISVDSEGNTRVGVLRGRATVSAGGGEVSLDMGEEMDVYGIADPQYDIVSIASPDRFDGWVVEREQRLARGNSHRYVSPYVVGVEDLDEYGRWVPIPGHGMVWTPTVVSAGWSPYVQGHWAWQDPWGWTWIAAEPWGWAPYHYGRWFQYTSRWYWAPVLPSAPRVAYAPALVAFVGGGGASLSVSIGSGSAIGWFPLAPADPLIPWWGNRRPVNVTNVNVTNVNVTNVKYVNKTYVTVVNHNTFVSGDLVQNNIVRDQTVIRQVNAAPIESGPLPVPTRASLRVSARATAASVRPAAAAPRQVVARIAPPPEPPRFERKLKVIQENRGAPVAPQTAARLAAEDRESPRARSSIRAVAEQQGEVRLKSRGKGRAERAPQPVRPVRGRPMATPENPVQAPQTAAVDSPPPPIPPGPVQPPAEGREGRKDPPGHSRDNSKSKSRVERPTPNQPEGRPNQPQPPAPGPNQPPAADPNQPQPPAQVPNQPPTVDPNQPRPPTAQERRKQNAEKRKQDRKTKGQQGRDPNATTEPDTDPNGPTP